MKTCSKIILLIITLLSAWSCDLKQPPCGDPAAESVEIWLVDKYDSSLLGKLYSPDSIKLLVDNQPIKLSFNNHWISFYYSYLSPFNNSTYLLYLNKTDVDTIKLVVENYENKCGKYNLLTSLNYNSKFLSPIATHIYKIQKK